MLLPYKASYVYLQRKLLLIGGVLLSHNLHANDLKIKSELEGKVEHADVDNSGSNTRGNIYSLAPTVSASLTTNHSTTNISGTYTGIQRDVDNQSSTYKDISRYQASSNIELVPELLGLNFSASQTYGSVNAENILASDIYLNDEDLSKNTRQSASLNFATSKVDIVNFGIGINLQHSEIERSSQTNSGSKTDSQSYVLTLSQGDEIKNVSWNLQSNIRNIETDNLNSRQFDTETYNGEVNWFFTKHMYWLLNGQFDKTNYDGQLTYYDIDQTYHSIGSGFGWKFSKRTDISVYFSKTKETDDSRDQFIGADLKWAPSDRTSLIASFGKRYFGDTSKLDFSYNTKHIRVGLNYSEDVTTRTQLQSDYDVAGTYVCPYGAESLLDCFLPDTLDYELQTGEVFTSLLEEVLSLTDQVMFTQRWNGTLAYSGRRTNLSLNYSDTSTQYSDSGYTQFSKTAGLNVSYKLGQNTSASLGSTYSDVSYSEERAGSTSWRHRFNLQHQLNKQTSVNAAISHLNRESDTSEQLARKDLRISLSLVYSFE